MQPQPKDIEYYLATIQREVKQGTRHVGWETVHRVHRKVIRYENGQPLVVSDVPISEDPETWKKNNPSLQLKGDVQRTREQELGSFEQWLEEATPEELEALREKLPSDDADTDVAPQQGNDEDNEDEDEDEVDEGDPEEFPASVGGPWWVLSNGDKVNGEAKARAAQYALDNPDEE